MVYKRLSSGGKTLAWVLMADLLLGGIVFKTQVQVWGRCSKNKNALFGHDSGETKATP